MTLEEARAGIDRIDPQIRELLAQRLDCSYQVAEAKKAEGSTTIYRADREAAILERLGGDVPEDRRPEYLAVVRKIMETSRMYQYGLLYDWDPSVFGLVDGHELCGEPSASVVVRLSRPDQPNAMSAILSMVGDYGFNMERMELVGGAAGEAGGGAGAGSTAGAGGAAGAGSAGSTAGAAGAAGEAGGGAAGAGGAGAGAGGEALVTFDLTILGDITQPQMRKLIFQLSKESRGFRILSTQPPQGSWRRMESARRA